MDTGRLSSTIIEAGNLIFDEKLVSDVTIKGEADYVTRADMAVQEFLREKLSKIYPGAGFISEENATNNYTAQDAVWILDPVDGTTNLTHHYGLSALSLGLYEGGVGKFGAIYNPVSRELFSATRGEGAYLNGRPIRTSVKQNFSSCLANYEFAPYYKDTSGLSFEIGRELFLRCQDIRSLGSAALGLVYVACGRADLFVSRNLKPWDHAAADIIISEAGGFVTDFAGNPPALDGVCSVAAGCEGLRPQLLDFVGRFAARV